DVLHVFADVTGLGERGGIDDAEGDIQHPGKRAGEKGLAGSRWSKQKDVRFFDLYPLEFIIEFRLILAEALVMVVNGDGENLLGVLLADDELIEMVTDDGRRGNLEAGLVGGCRTFGGRATEFLFKDVRADVDAFVAYVNPRP